MQTHTYIYMCVYIHAIIYIYICVYMYIYMQSYIYICMYIYMHIYMCVYVYIHAIIYIYACIYTCNHIYICVCICIYTCNHIYLYTRFLLPDACSLLSLICVWMDCRFIESTELIKSWERTNSWEAVLEISWTDVQLIWVHMLGSWSIVLTSVTILLILFWRYCTDATTIEDKGKVGVSVWRGNVQKGSGGKGRRNNVGYIERTNTTTTSFLLLSHINTHTHSLSLSLSLAWTTGSILPINDVGNELWDITNRLTLWGVCTANDPGPQRPC